MALDRRNDVEKLKRMMAFYERVKAKEAELAYNAAKGRIFIQEDMWSLTPVFLCCHTRSCLIK